MIHSLYKKVVDQIFYRWMERDLQKFLRQVEEMPRKKAAEQSRDMNGVTVAEWKQKMWDYGTHLMEYTYEEGRPPDLKPSIHQQAEAVTADLIATFGLKEEHPLSAFFPSPPERNGDSGIRNELFGELQDVMKKHSFAQALALVKQEKELQTLIQSLGREHFSFLEKKLFKPGERDYATLVWKLLDQATRDIIRFSRKHKLFFSDDGEIRCFYNMLNLYLHYFAIHGRVIRSMKDRELVFAASALHPLQDDYLDENLASEEAVHAIGEKVQGRQISPVNEKTRGIFDLIDVIYAIYPAGDNPMLVTIFSNLHRYQCLSGAQKNKSISEERLLELSFMKGGYAFAFFGYVIHGEMSMAQFNHFFIMGAIFQILDDFHDIEEDLESGSTTVWTRAVQTGKPADSVLNAVISLQRYYEKHTNAIPDFAYPVFIRRIELLGIRYDAFRFFTMNESCFSSEYVTEFENCFPFSLSIPKKIYTSSRPYEQIDTLIKGLEEGRELFMEGK